MVQVVFLSTSPHTQITTPLLACLVMVARLLISLVFTLPLGCSESTPIQSPNRAKTPQAAPADTVSPRAEDTPLWFAALQDPTDGAIGVLGDMLAPEVKLRWVDDSLAFTGKGTIVSKLEQWRRQFQIRTLKGTDFGSHIGLELTGISRDSPRFGWHQGYGSREKKRDSVRY